MTAAYEQNLESKKRRSRFVTQAQIVGHKMSGKRKRQWDVITKQIAESGAMVHVLYPAEHTVQNWKRECQAAGIGTGLLSWFFWNFFLPYLIELAQNWIEAQRNADTQHD
jgi:hypothetical protein